MATLADFFSLPIGGYGAKPNPYLKSESGRPVYETPLGVTFEIQPQAKSEDAKKRAIVDALVSGQKKSPFYGPAQAEMDVQRQGAEATLGGLLPGLLQGVLQGVEAPGRAARGEPVTYGDVWSTALDYGALGAPMKAPDNALGIFAGRRAKTADLDALARAERMAADGADRTAIWSDTGWFKGADGQWRFEIDDSGFAPDVQGFYDETDLTRGADTASGAFGEFYNHPSLFDAYPDASDIRTAVKPDLPYAGAYLPNKGSLVLRDDFADGTVPLHEIQHYIQGQEGFSLGSSEKLAAAAATSPEIEFLQRRLKGMGPLNSEYVSLRQRLRNAQKELAAADYRRTAGEVEARNVQTRRDYTPEQRRATPPWQTQDVPDAEQILRFDGGGPQMSVDLDPPGLLGGIRAYHGSPHDFDRFDLSKIGTGEGKQAEGMGLYFAQNEDVARKYRDNLSNRAGHDAGRVYEVNIKADESDFVDFDKPLSGQPPAVQKWFDGRGVSPAFAGEQSGLELLMLERSAMGDDALAASMRDAGIPGIKFRDNWSKGKSAQDATRNFVVFDDRLIEIVRKYGIAGAAAMLGMSAAELQAQMGGASAAPSADDLRSYLNELN